MRYSFKQARHLLAGLGPEEMEQVRAVCRDIRQAQQQLGLSARTNLNRCYSVCQGICCRNVDIDAVISHWDFVFLLASDESLATTIPPCLDRENRFYPDDCIFLADGIGPCLFPDGLRPEVCITSFCTETPALSPEIRRVKKQFRRLSGMIRRLRFRAFIRALGFTGRCL